MKKYKIPKISFTGIRIVLWGTIRVLQFAWKYRNTIIGLFGKFPPLPVDWRNSEQVRRWFVATLDSPLVRGFVKDTPNQWDDKIRLSLLAAAQQNVLWDTIWSIFIQDGGKVLPIPKPDPKRIRERISQLIHFRRERNITHAVLLTPQQIEQAASITSLEIPLLDEDVTAMTTSVASIQLACAILTFAQTGKNPATLHSVL